jgi:putative transcriptional regulator
MKGTRKLSNFVQNLRVAMAARDVSQTSLAKAIGVSRQHMHGIYHGQKTPSSSRLVDMAKILNVSMDYLLGADDVQGQIEDVLRHRPVRMTARQAYEAQK